MTDIFEKGTREGTRFQLPAGYKPEGLLTTEQMWKVNKPALLKYEEVLISELEKYGKTTRRKSNTKTQQQENTELQLAIVSHILDVLESEQEAQVNEAAKKKHNEPILAMMAMKKEQDMLNKSYEELDGLLLK
jgi:hypothetical protein